MRRRTFLGAAGLAVAADTRKIPVIDTHIHLFDPTRPQGVPWPPPTSSIYKPALPERFRQLTKPLGVTGAIEIECSPWTEDNQWVLDVAAKDAVVVGTIGHLEPGAADFGKQLERFHRNPLFRGIRCGNLWGNNLPAELAKPQFAAGLKLLSQAGLVLDTANPDAALLEAVVRVTDAVPDLRVVIDHLPQMNSPSESVLRSLGARPQVYVKLSEVLRREDGRVPEDLEFYRDRLDTLYGVFGEDRVLYGSDWPNSDPLAPYATVIGLVRKYFEGKSQAAAEKYFWKNSVAAYRWTPRESAQPR